LQHAVVVRSAIEHAVESGAVGVAQNAFALAAAKARLFVCLQKKKKKKKKKKEKKKKKKKNYFKVRSSTKRVEQRSSSLTLCKTASLKTNFSCAKTDLVQTAHLSVAPNFGGVRVDISKFHTIK
jgi:hypothetical protein